MLQYNQEWQNWRSRLPCQMPQCVGFGCRAAGCGCACARCPRRTVQRGVRCSYYLLCSLCSLRCRCLQRWSLLPLGPVAPPRRCTASGSPLPDSAKMPPARPNAACKAVAENATLNGRCGGPWAPRGSSWILDYEIAIHQLTNVNVNRTKQAQPFRILAYTHWHMTVRRAVPDIKHASRAGCFPASLIQSIINKHPFSYIVLFRHRLNQFILRYCADSTDPPAARSEQRTNVN